MYPNAINLVTLDVCGFHDDKKLSLLAHWDYAYPISVLCLQETYLGLDDLSTLCKYFLIIQYLFLLEPIIPVE